MAVCGYVVAEQSSSVSGVMFICNTSKKLDTAVAVFTQQKYFRLMPRKRGCFDM